MSLSSFSPRPTASKSSCSPPPSQAFISKNHNDEYGHGSLPLSNPTLLGQLHQFPGPTADQERGIPRKQHPTYDNTHENHHHHPLRYQHLYVLPVLLLEFLAIALTRAVLPGILLKEYGSSVYLVLGGADCMRGLLAFIACPIFGKLSDILGRRLCLFITVLGSCAPVCSLAFFSWEHPVDSFLNTDGNNTVLDENHNVSSRASKLEMSMPPVAIPMFVILLSLSGIFSSTFTLVFAYISDSVRGRDERVSAYGLALATFGLSFTLGPMTGGYLANYKTDYVFQCTLALTILDLLYIYWILPESKQPRISLGSADISEGMSVASAATTSTLLMQVADSISWSPWESLKLVLQDPFLRKVGQVAFFYYTGLWAVISTLSLYAVQHFGLTPERLGELMSALGLSTMVAEAVLVRVMVPLVGEKRAIRIGLMSFTLQCMVLGAANEAYQLFLCVGLSLLGNLVYPSLSSLVSGTVPQDSVGEALGAINGIKALTEGIGPLFFGALMTVSEHTAFPGSPYWLAGLLVLVAYRLAGTLPADTEPSQYSSLSSPDKYPPYPISSPEEDYIHELEFKRRYKWFRQPRGRQKNVSDYGYRNGGDDEDDCLAAMFPTPVRDEEDEEYRGLLSEIEESEEEVPAASILRTPNRISSPPPAIAARVNSFTGRETSNSFHSVDLGFTNSFLSYSPGPVEEAPSTPSREQQSSTENSNLSSSDEDMSFARKPIQK